MTKLFAVFLGGSAPRSNTELHDVVFVVGEKIESTYRQLLELWFGVPDGLHIDSWIELSVVDGHRVTLSEREPSGDKRLYFINLGAYAPGEFNELHTNTFLVSNDRKDVRTRGKERMDNAWESKHTDYLYEVDDCLEIHTVGKLFVHLDPTDEPENLLPNNGYHKLPKDVIEEFKESTVRTR